MRPRGLRLAAHEGVSTAAGAHVGYPSPAARLLFAILFHIFQTLSQNDILDV